VFQRYLCKNCGRTFNDKTGTVFEHSSVALRKWFLAVYTYIRFNTSLRQLDVEIDVSFKTVYRRVQRFLRALDAPRVILEGPVEIDELYVSAGKKGRERDRPSRSRGLSTRGRGTYHEDKPPVFIVRSWVSDCWWRHSAVSRIVLSASSPGFRRTRCRS
jgi:transposase